METENEKVRGIVKMSLSLRYSSKAAFVFYVFMLSVYFLQLISQFQRRN
uniref:Peptidyl-prolyl cis-trans isomerase n=1 Tax=Rhizophora mucronata TaxID=61149 RepID=A0A2P2J6N9_RHIMU